MSFARITRFSVFALATVVATAAMAANFLPANALKLQPLLLVPPATNSIAQNAEIEVLLHLQAERTPQGVLRARQIDNEDIFLFGSDVLGPWFNATNLPQTAAFFARVHADFVPINRAAKEFSNRRRPPFLDARIKPCVDFTDSGSYPSGHAMQAEMWSTLLSAIFPDQAVYFADRASATRWTRLIAGVHYPTDVEAGRLVGEAIARTMLKNPALPQIIEELRAEASRYRTPKAA